jgi:hypothetical protein
MQEEVSQNYFYRQIIREELRQLKREADRIRFIQFFRKYWFKGRFVVPPWAEADLAFYEQEKYRFTYLTKRISECEVPTHDSQLGWAPLPKSKQWMRVVEGQCVSPKIYFTCNLWKKGTPSEASELAFLRTQLLDDMLIYPGEFDFGVADAAERAAFCHAVVWFFADVLIFSEFEAEYGRFLGYGVYHDILEA